jgi:predicted 3-demethylubiquinone-9 3-methyltransferase (glyoxalase superfamily)
MKNSIYPCLWFNGQGKEAAELYTSLLPDFKITSDNGMVVMFELMGKKIMALNGGPHFKMNPSISLFMYLKNVDDVNKVWNKLIDGGKAMIEIDKQPWSERYGWLQDKYGCTWQISVGEKNELKPSFLFANDQFGHAEEAQKFYTSIFPQSGTKQLMHYSEGDSNKGKVLYSEFTLNGSDFAAMDGPGKHDFKFNEGFSLVIDCADQKDIDHYWDSLTKGGEESMCGWLKDKYGVSWQVVPSSLGKLMSDKQRAQRVMKEIMKMKKLDLEVLERA